MSRIGSLPDDVGWYLWRTIYSRNVLPHIRQAAIVHEMKQSPWNFCLSDVRHCPTLRLDEPSHDDMCHPDIMAWYCFFMEKLYYFHRDHAHHLSDCRESVVRPAIDWHPCP